ncbi:stage V sporulation protein AD, partial (plasmid) [Clostridium perfringens]
MSNDTKRVGSQTIELKSKPRIIATYSVVGPREGQGPLKEYFDKILQDDCNGCESFEKAESSLMITAIEGVIKKGNVKEEDVDYLFSGDLLNQLTSTN